MRAWNGSDGADWFTPGEWSPAGLPSPADALTVSTGRPVTEPGNTVSVSNGGSITLSGPSAAMGQQREFASWRAPNLRVGNSGAGRVLVEGGATLTSMLVHLGVQSGSKGEVTLRGTGSTWAVGVSGLQVGADAGEGVLNVLDHASIRYFDEVLVAYGRQSTGTLTVDDASFSAIAFKVGEGGRGAMVVRNAGAVSSWNTFVGFNAGAQGAFGIDGPGSTLTSSGSMAVARFGRGDVTVTGGGVVSNGGDLIIGDETGHGTVSLAGSGSKITNLGSVYVGAAEAKGGIGELNLGPGSSVTAGRSIVLSDGSRLSYTAGGTTAAPISGGGEAVLGGSLYFDFTAGFLPPASTRSEVLTADLGLTGRFSQFVTDEPVNLVYGTNAVWVQVVPEPGGVLLACAAAPGLLLRRRRSGERRELQR